MPIIEKIEIFPVRYAMTGYFKFFTDQTGKAGRAALLTKVTAEDGTVGWGQSVPIALWSYETPETAKVLLEKYYAPALIGHEAEDIEGAHELLDKTVAHGFSTGNPITRAGLDLALHDLAGKIQGQSLAQMYGRTPGGSIELSWTVNVTDLNQVEERIAEGRQKGFRHYNIKVGPDPQFDYELARQVREAAPDSFLWADANMGYTTENALKAAPRLANIGVDVLEAPLRPNLIQGYRELRKQGALPILMDEGVVSPTDVETFSSLDMIDGVAMKPARCGGLLSCKQQIEICQQQEMMWLGSGLTDPDIGFAASVSLYAAYGLNKPAALNGPPQFVTEDMVTNPVQIAQGRAYATEQPGLGVQIDEDKVRNSCILGENGVIIRSI